MDRQLILATGKAMALIGAMLERGGIVTAEEFGGLLAVFAVTVAEAEPEQGDILAVWAGIIKEVGAAEGLA